MTELDARMWQSRLGELLAGKQPPWEGVELGERPAQDPFGAGDDLLAGRCAQLAELYRSVSHVSLPQLANGFWLHSLDLVRRGIQDPLTPGSILQVGEQKAVVFASDGGGGQFAVGCTSGRVYYLPPGGVEDGVYSGFPATPVETLADSLDTFLGDLLDIVRQS